MDIVKKIATVCIIILNVGTVYTQSATQKIDKDYYRNLEKLAAVYKDEGKYFLADSLYNEMIPLSKQYYGEASLKYAKVLNDQIDVRIESDLLEGLDNSIEKVLGIRKKYLGENSLEYAEGLNNRGRYLITAARFEEAEADMEKAAKIRLNIAGSKSDEYFNSLVNLGNLYFYKQNFIKAKDCYLQAIENSIQLENKRNQAFASVCLASLNIYIGEYGEAQNLMIQTLPLAKNYLGERHPDYVTSLSNLGSLYTMQGEFAKAEPLLKEALQLTYESFGEEHSQYFTTLNALAYLYQELNMFEQAEPMYEKSIMLRKKLYGETNPVVATALNHLAIFQINIGNFKKAEKTALEGLKVAGKSLDVSSLTHATLSNTLGMAYLEQKKFDVALNTFKNAAKILEENSEESNPVYLTILNNISSTIYEDTTQNISAIEPILLYTIEKMRSIYGEGQPQYLSALNSLATFYKANDEFEKSEKLYQTILNNYEKNIGQNSWKYITFLWNAALNSELLNKPEEAQSRYMKCFEIMKTLTAQDFAFLSEEEREYYWFARLHMIKHWQEYAVRAKILDPSLTAFAYNLELFSKSLLLNSSGKLQETILNNPE
ncbi:MAG: tetratricopeptide repeat protein, partial [Bacteroidales bacterium]|nr:tetratricopeptide repeat protein [Bacteroidales bacterium]